MHINLDTLTISGVNRFATLVATDIDTNENINKIVSTRHLINLHSLVENLYSFKPSEIVTENKYNSIIINTLGATYLPLDGADSWVIQFSDIKTHLLDNLIDEIIMTV